MVRAGLGVAILPESASEIDRRDDLRSVTIRRPALTRQISIFCRSGRSLSPAAQRLVEEIRNQSA
jgi:DNA-binding transcriptional LysR family regulator